MRKIKPESPKVTLEVAMGELGKFFEEKGLKGQILRRAPPSRIYNGLVIRTKAPVYGKFHVVAEHGVINVYRVN